MKICPSCQLEYDNKYAFCKKCGSQLVAKEERRTCPKCGSLIETNGSFCPHCGASLSGNKLDDTETTSGFKGDNEKKLTSNLPTGNIYVLLLGVLVILGFLYFNFKDNLYDAGIVQPSIAVEQTRYAQRLEEKGNLESAFQWYRKAAEQGDIEAQYHVGYMYDYGVGIGKNHKEAVVWYKKAAELGHAQAQCNLALIYDSGGRLGNREEAISWYKKAAEQGVRKAQFILGSKYEKGHVVTKDYKEAFKWYKKAAEQGDGQAQYNVGHMYYYGKGIEKNEEEAIKWFKKSADNGINYAEATLKKLGY
ncbi:double zinc ribbon domain-containing protein [Succiniclasticum ruminis]|uniref:Sel1 repeat-containing protein n=1 Tax=Succiniclasticum ruminis DSM 9236 TaxID=1123323 RepID=A0A1I2E659_9FIRM|nr:zinc ribbon domain-containing protein [Succiniclasticum ruminis]SFE87978.1 Sel1 repeat-containing protein [Succiniclasticum ruminis DSM 9236]